MVSVVVPTYNRPTRIRHLLAQIAAQSLPTSGFEVIVVDDGSRDDLRATVRPQDHRFALQVERQPHAGAEAARQLGAGRASGELLVFVDDDLELPPGFLEAHVTAHEAGDRLVVLGRRRAGAGEGAGLPLVERYRIGMGDRLADEVRSGRLEITGEYLYTGNVSLPRSLFAEVGGFDPEFALVGDAELGIRLEKAGARFVFSDEAFNSHERDPITPAAWFERSMRDGVYWSRMGRKHPDTVGANPWHFLDLVNPVSRPLLTLSAVAPAPAALLARTAFGTARAADALRLGRVAIAGTTFVYSVQMFRGVGREAGGPVSALREYREFRRGIGALRHHDGSPFRELIEAIREDHRVLVQTSTRHDPRERNLGSPAQAAVENIGFQLVIGYRVMRYMRALGLPLATRFVARSLRHLYGSDVHWDADLAPGLVVVHGFGLAISHAARTGHGCVLSQNVTLGMGRDPSTGATGAPELGENVVIGPGATLIGPIVIGDGSKIMPGCTVAESVPPRTVVEAPAVTMRPR